jgi:hypothetical protein
MQIGGQPRVGASLASSDGGHANVVASVLLDFPLPSLRSIVCLRQWKSDSLSEYVDFQRERPQQLLIRLA